MMALPVISGKNSLKIQKEQHFSHLGSMMKLFSGIVTVVRLRFTTKACALNKELAPKEKSTKSQIKKTSERVFSNGTQYKCRNFLRLVLDKIIYAYL